MLNTIDRGQHLVRALTFCERCHEVDPQGRGLLMMHSDVYHNLSQPDVVAFIAYLKTVPPVDRETPEPDIKTLGKIMVVLGNFDSAPYPLIPAEKIDHDAPFIESPQPGVSAEYGAYLVSITLCRMCHGPNLAGGSPHHLEPFLDLLRLEEAVNFIQMEKEYVYP